MARVESPPRGEHAAILRSPEQFETLRRKDDFLAEGVAAIFGVRGREAELQALYFQTDKFTMKQAKQWLSDLGLAAIDFTTASGEEAVDFPGAGKGGLPGWQRAGG